MPVRRPPRRARCAFGLLLLPAAGLAAGASPVLVESLFGPAYRRTSPLFAALVLGAVGTLLLSLASGILVAAGRPRWTIAFSLPMLPVATLGYLLAVPRAGALGAALVTAGTAIAAAAGACGAAHRLTGARFPLGTLARTVLLGTAAFAAGATLLPAPGIAGLLGIAALGISTLAALAFSGEPTPAERQRFQRWVASAFRSVRRSAA